MILHSLKVSGWRNLLSETEVGPFSDRLNVLHAPNGTGKSSLFEAMQRGLLDSHRFSGEDMEAVQPWGRHLPPDVTITFTHQGTTYRIHKRFLHDQESLLERKEDDAFKPFDSGRQADDYVRDMLTKNPPGRGLSQQKHWGLSQVLWAPQGNLALQGLSSDLVEDVRGAMGAQLAAHTLAPVEKKIEDIYLSIFTPTGKKYRSGKNAARIVDLQEELDEVLKEKRQADEDLLVFEEAQRTVEDYSLRREQARLAADEMESMLEKTRKRRKAYLELDEKKMRLQDAQSAAESEYRRLKQQVDLIESAGKSLKRNESRLKQLQKELESASRDLEVQEKELSEARRALEDLSGEREKAERKREEADSARTFISVTEDFAACQDRLEKIDKARERLENSRKERGEFIAPDKETLKELRKEIKNRDKASTLIDASLITLEIEPEKKSILDVLTGEETGSRDLAAGYPVQIKGSPEVVVDLQGIARLRASGPEGDIKKHRSQFSDAVERIRKLCEPYGTEDMDELEKQADKAEKLDRDVESRKSGYEALLDGEDYEVVRREFAAKQTAFERQQKDHPDWIDEPPDWQEMSGEADRLASDVDEKQAAAEKARDHAQQSLSALKEDRREKQTSIHEVEKTTDEIRKQLEDLQSDGMDAEKRDLELAKQLEALRSAEEELEKVESDLERFPADPGEDIERLEAQLESLRNEVDELREKENTAEGRLEAAADKGAFSAAVRAAEQCAALEQEIRQEELRTDAIKMLRDTVERYREKASEDVTGPVEGMATKFMHRIAGPRTGVIQMSSGLEPAHILPRSVDNPVAVDNLSGGEKEQLYLSTRLALAGMLSAEERQLVVLDDVLISTDSGRFARVLSVLEEAADLSQILMLTCHPERYRGLRDAEFFDLEAICSS